MVPIDDYPPLGCRRLFPPRPWCREQLEAAQSFCRKCQRMLEGNLDERQRTLWERLEGEANGSEQLWRWLAEAQDPTNVSGTEVQRREVLGLLYQRLGPDDFFAGRMPSPIPWDAPRD